MMDNMTRRFSVAATILVTVSLCFCRAAPVKADEAGSLPNIVLIMVDDMGFADLGCYGGEIDTPAIDRLAREGVQLDRFYSAPICSPTRAALMTGRDPLKLGIAYDQIHPWYSVGLAPDTITIADVFKHLARRL